MSGKTYTTAQAAKLIGVSRQTLQRWIADGLIKAPALIGTGNATLRLWTAKDVEHAKKFKGALRPGPKLKARR